MSAWIALTDSNPSNGCVELVPGSHGRLWRHVPEPWAFGIAAGRAEVAHHRRVPLVLDAGQFFLFDNRVVHGSGQNRSHHPRIGLAARYTTPFVAIGAAEHTPLRVRTKHDADPRD